MYCRDFSKLKEVFRLEYERAKSLLASCKSGIDVEVKEHKHKRSNAQNDYYWQFNTELAEFLKGAGVKYGKHNLPYNKNLVHDINKTVFGIETTTKMSRKEFCDYMTELFVFWNDETGGHFEMSELPDSYLETRGYTAEYMRQ